MSCVGAYTWVWQGRAQGGVGGAGAGPTRCPPYALGAAVVDTMVGAGVLLVVTWDALNAVLGLAASGVPSESFDV